MQRTSIFAITVRLACLLCIASVTPSASAQEGQPKKTVEPVFRVPNIKKSQSTDKPEINADQSVNHSSAVTAQSSQAQPVARVADASPVAPTPDKLKTDLVPKLDAAADTNAHPLDRAIDIAKVGLDNMKSTIHDYTAVMVKRERVGDQLSDPMFMKIKIRNPRVLDEREIPFSIYMKFVKPRAVCGREVIWVEGQNNNNLIVHDTNPLVRFKNLNLDPKGFLAMKGNKYPIYDAGLENLVIKLIEKAERDRAAGMCEVKYQPGAKINKRPCTLIEVKHNQQRAPYEFHIAKVYIDDEYQIPVRFAAYDWPVGNRKPALLEEYTYVNVNLNVGLSDSDFDIKNRAYNFAK